MPRMPRPVTPGFPHHTISRFLNRERRLRDDLDRVAFLGSLGRARKFHPVRALCYALMSTHVHLTLVGETEPVGKLLHRTNTAFGMRWNRQHGGLGPVVAHRPKSIVVTKGEQLARLIAYQHNNPGRAGLVDCPSESTWTSHRIYIGEQPCPAYLDVEWALAAIGFSSNPSGRLAFHEYVRSRRRLRRDPSLSGPSPSSIPQALQLVVAAMHVFSMSLEQLSRPRRTEHKERRLIVVATALEVVGVSVKHLAAALGVSPQYLSRLRPLAQGKASLTLLDAFVEPRIKRVA